MESNLKFLRTMSVEQFKAMQNVEQIQILHNENTGKCFFVYGLETGPCTKRAKTGGLTNPVISQVCNAETGETYYMLHQRGEGGATTLALL